MENRNIDIGKVIVKTLTLIIVKPLTLPWQIYQNAMVSLSNSDDASSEENVLASEFPLYVWFVSIFNALIFLTYPLGVIVAIIAAMNAYNNGFQIFLGIIIGTYFIPLYFGLVRELLTVTLKTVYYLKRIANK
tara:strand:+ start:211 stop:609 length:399 start_codon:yes stop_codon:yes gene_type:complete